LADELVTQSEHNPAHHQHAQGAKHRNWMCQKCHSHFEMPLSQKAKPELQKPLVLILGFKSGALFSFVRHSEFSQPIPQCIAREPQQARCLAFVAIGPP
jgi:hypothetical protein